MMRLHILPTMARSRISVSTRTNLFVCLASCVVFCNNVCSTLEVRCNHFSRQTDMMQYSALEVLDPVQLMVRSELDCAGLCSVSDHCVVFAFSPGYRECILAGLPTSQVLETHFTRSDSLFYFESNGCVSVTAVFLKPIGKCVELLDSAMSGSWQEYRDVCSQTNPNDKLLELPAADDIYYMVSVVFASDFFPPGRMWVGARGTSNGTNYIMEWVTGSLPVKTAVWESVIAPTIAQEPYSDIFEVDDDDDNEVDDDDDDGDYMSTDDPDMCGYLEKTDVGVFLQMVVCEHVSALGQFALCERQTM